MTPADRDHPGEDPESGKLVRCPKCRESFEVREIATHPDVDPVGMLFEKGDHLYFFNHTATHCGTTFVVPAKEFLPYITELVPEFSLVGTEECEGRCSRLNDLEDCEQACRYAPFRRYLLAMRARRAKPAQPPPESS